MVILGGSGDGPCSGITQTLHMLLLSVLVVVMFCYKFFLHLLSCLSCGVATGHVTALHACHQLVTIESSSSYNNHKCCVLGLTLE